ncbi:hypothetical protein DDZ14_10030 [Maritimibacter sp. 55A14]|uniref:lytic transglycosylase domain-containing protein n=1 Tax=Maritimibacter sp. 55A14 TaxID=2174844 RepID=UPI000D60AA4C|nr:lytic transglycosylase domain-containing protein [Maritimibacter sp. 55A14]PWE32398.1 hypothetical protein DDZ14_10030 [Maritimibacter sp. 55A14]
MLARPLALLRMMAAVFLLCGPAAALPDEADGAALAEALAAARSGDWARAEAALSPIDTPAALSLLEWIKLHNGAGFWEDYDAFLNAHPDWPGLDRLRSLGEREIGSGAEPKAVIAYFDGAPPQTGAGVVRLVEAFAALGRAGDAGAEVVRAWRSMVMSAEDEAYLLKRFPDLLAPHHEARLDMLLWRGSAGVARRMYPLVSDGWRALAEARIALRSNASGVDTRIDAVPEDLADDPGLAHERFAWRAARGRTDDAIELLRARSVSQAALGVPDAWSSRRRALAREKMREGDVALAYEIASRHFLVDGSDFADLEWLSGYIALTQLGHPGLAVDHFTRFRNYVETPISRGRAGYWLGRAYEALGEAENAKAAYAFGARYQTSFYGQLAAERGGIAPDADLSGAEDVAPWRQAAFAETPVLQAAVLLHRAGQTAWARQFFTHMAGTLERRELAQLTDLVLELGEPHIALMLSKRAARRGIEVPKGYYPLTALTRQPVPVPMELALAIARRESEFDPLVVSPAGARGLMQLMPGTAKAMAAKTGQQYSAARLTDDWTYNVALGTAYLAELMDVFDGSIVLVAAAYNAGPSRASAWIEAFGDPRADGVDVVDWIEHIPFRETRNYVMRVMESLHVYRARLGGRAAPLRLTMDLKEG